MHTNFKSNLLRIACPTVIGLKISENRSFRQKADEISENIFSLLFNLFTVGDFRSGIFAAGHPQREQSRGEDISISPFLKKS